MGINPHLPNVHSDGKRPEVIGCAAAAVERYLSGAPVTGIEVPPRVGKASIARIIALECRQYGAPYVLHVVPWVNLTEQMLDDKKTADFKRIYGITAMFMRDSVETIKHYAFYKRLSGTPALLTTTLSLVHVNIDSVVDSVNVAIEETGKRPVIILDEVHIVKWTKALGTSIKQLMDAGAYLVSLTGTPVRADRGLIPGFQHNVLSTEDAKEATRCKGRYTDDDGQAMMVMARGESVAKEIELSPIGSDPVAWSLAFQRKWLMQCNFIKLDFRIPELDCLLSEASKKDVRLSEIVKSEECIAVGVSAMLSRLIVKRVASGKRVQALVITGSDEGFEDREGANHHARDIRRSINDQIELLSDRDRRILGGLTIEIATSVNDDGTPDVKATNKINAFVAGETDVLIVKMMALVGMDAPGCKVNLFMSPIRKGPLVAQAATRHLTPSVNDDFRFAGDLIIPWDSGAQELSENFTQMNGTLKVEEFTEHSEFETPLEEKEPEDLTLMDGRVGGYADQYGNVHNGDHEALLRAIKTKYATLVRGLTDAVILGGYQSGAFPVDDIEIQSERVDASVCNENLSKLREKTEGKANIKAKRIVNAHFSYVSDPNSWKAMLAAIHRKAKSLAKVQPGTKLQDIDDPAIIQRIIDAMDVIDVDQIKATVMSRPNHGGFHHV